MKPMYRDLKRLSRCACCVSGFSKHRAGTSKTGNSAARQKAKRDMRREAY